MSKQKAAKVTPLMKQYNAVKAKHPGAMLLFRVGDFYETFGEDAVKASRILDIVLTKRANGSASEVELAGFPHHALDTYLPKLVRSGERVAICDQLEDPKTVKGIVKRGVTELVTPGLSYNDNVLDKNQNNYLASVGFQDESIGISFLDLSTGEFLTAEGTAEYCNKLLQGFRPSEVLFNKDYRSEFLECFGDSTNAFGLEDWIYSFDYAYEKLTKHFNTNSLKGFGVDKMKSAIVSAGAVLHYLDETEHRDLAHISSISRIDQENHVWLDRFTIRNLELIHAQQDGGIPLIDILDRTVTAMGARLLKKWIVLPLKSIAEIEKRHSIVQKFVDDDKLSESTISNLKEIGDLERLISKVAVSRINPRELVYLKNSLQYIDPILELIEKDGSNELKHEFKLLDPCKALVDRIATDLKEDAPLLVNQGGIINEGVDAELDELRKIAYSGKDYLLQIKDREVERTGISSLKIAYNKVFGYYLEVSNAHKDKVPEEWIRKQTLVNAERYITEELKVYEEKILNAEEQIQIIENRLYQDLVRASQDYINQVQTNAGLIAKLDCLVSFAESAARNAYCRPKLDDSLRIVIKNGRHPVIEQQLPLGEQYVPNDVFLDNEKQQIMIITGPNMAGKSALLRQTALIVLMAQIGSFVPAKSASIGIIDKVFTRVGASDNLSAGESTFMVEMTETASILNNLSDRSLILMDEIGRGTSTYDGVSIAWSIVEYLHNNPNVRPKTLFATHYHELNQLTNDLPRVKNYNVSVKQVGEDVVFIRKLVEGGSEHSFGIHVAQMAGMPNQIVLRADEIMRFLEKDRSKKKNKTDLKKMPAPTTQMTIFSNDPRMEELKSFLEKIDINTVSPVEALLKLNEALSILKKASK